LRITDVPLALVLVIATLIEFGVIAWVAVESAWDSTPPIGTLLVAIGFTIVYVAILGSVWRSGKAWRP
jgi:hypothetical protein